jgi:kynurenine 3-monooxygenase
MLGLPNLDGSFTLSFILPYEGPLSFASIRTPEDLLELFKHSFPDALPMLPTLTDDYFSRPPTSLITIRCAPWTVGDKVALIGDAAHAIVPYYGHGANAGFEDCHTLAQLIQQYGEDWRKVLSEYERQRRPNTDTIAELSLRHHAELRDWCGQRRFLVRKEVERKLNRLYPARYSSLYAMVTFQDRPYQQAVQADQAQRGIVEHIMQLENVDERWDSPEVEELMHALMRAAS